MNYFWKNKMDEAADAVRYLCPLCDKPTPEGKSKWKHVPLHPGSLEAKHWLWTCMHCGATHKEGRESLVK